MKSTQLKSLSTFDKKSDRLIKIFKQYPEIKSAYVIAVDKDSDESDLDIMINYVRGTSFFTLSGLQYDIEQLFGDLNVNLLNEKHYRNKVARTKVKRLWHYQQRHCS